MFDEIFFPRTAGKHRAAPLAEPRARYLRHLKEIGASRGTLRKCANNHLNLVRLLNPREDGRINIHEIEAAAAIWSRPKGRRCGRAATSKARQRFISHGIDLLRFLGWADEAKENHHPHHAEVRVFEEWLRNERALADATTDDYCHAADHFFLWLAGRDTPLNAIQMSDVDDAIATEHLRGAWNRRTIHDYAQRLRPFFAFAEERGWCRTGLAAGIMAPRFMADETVPKGIRRDDVVRLLPSVEGDRPVEKRDRAILMLFVAHGLRAGEVAGLRLDDLDWENGIIRVRCPKPGRTHVWPLTPTVGQAILRYITDVRPTCHGRSLFFTSRAPIRPVGRKTLGKIVHDRLAGIGIVTGRRGTHALRHAAAQHLLDQGMSMKVIGDFLGHSEPVLHRDLRQGQRRGTPRSGGPRSGGAGMTLREAIEQYILWRQAHGAKFTTAGNLLRQFLQHADGDAECDAVTTAQVLAFLAGEGPVTRHRENKNYALAGFWRYAISRSFAHCSPLPDDEPRSPLRAPPYIYARDELRRLFDPTIVEISRRGARQLDAVTFRTLLLLLYGAGLRFSEATGLTLADVNLSEAILTIRDTKFHKSRLVPVGPQLAAVLTNYVSVRPGDGLTRGDAAFLLANRDGTRLSSSTVQTAFETLRRVAEVRGAEAGRQVPRLHDLRHSFAVHSMTAWYRHGADVQRLLPVLSTYLGHSDLEGTKVYLSMTPELLQQASLRFARYAAGGENV